ncbi:MAG: S8 family peptidase [Inquilinaceae bacterium]
MPADFVTAEYLASYGLPTARAASAYGIGATGAGVKVAVIDSGIDLDHPDFAGAIDPASFDIVASSFVTVDDQNGHGTAVAGLVGARRNGSGMHGVAYESTLLAIRTDDNGPCNPSCGFQYTDLAAATNYAVANNALILNYSLGGPASNAGFEAALLNATANGLNFVASSGNSGGANPEFPAALAADGRFNGQGIAAGAVDQNNQIASFSNRAGTAQNFFLVAPGVSVLTTTRGGGFGTASGTSFSAPQIAGALALIRQRWPGVTAQQAVDILLQSATDLGAAGTDPIYGRGLLNLQAAFAPLGASSVPTTGATALTASGASLEASGLSLGGAFGDALAGESAFTDVVFLDSYARDFQTDLSPAIQSTVSAIDLEGWLTARSDDRTLSGGDLPVTVTTSIAETTNAWDDPDGLYEPDRRFAIAATPAPGLHVGFSDGYGLGTALGLGSAAPSAVGGLLAPDARGTPYLRLAGKGRAIDLAGDLGGGFTLALGASSVTADGADATRTDRDAYVAELRHRSESGIVLGLSLGTLGEDGSLLDSVGGGALALGDDTDTGFVGLFGLAPLDGSTDLFGGYATGVTRAAADGSSLIRDIDGVRSDSFTVGVARRDLLTAGDRLTIALSQPLRVSAGRATAVVPVSVSANGAIERRTETVSLVPSGREIDLDIGYRVPLGPADDVSVNLMIARQPGHVADAAPEGAAGIKYRLKF